jgi:hypothetical protein
MLTCKMAPILGPRSGVSYSGVFGGYADLLINPRKILCEKYLIVLNSLCYSINEFVKA